MAKQKRSGFGGHPCLLCALQQQLMDECLKRGLLARGTKQTLKARLLESLDEEAMVSTLVVASRTATGEQLVHSREQQHLAGRAN